MKIAYCIYDYTAGGGTERIISRKCNALIEAGFDICIINTCQSHRPTEFAFSEKIEVRDLSINYFKIRNYNLLIKVILYPLLYPIHKYKLLTVLKKTKPDILISTFGHEAKIVPFIKYPCKKVLEFHHSRGYKVIELKHRNLSNVQKQIIQYRENKEYKLVSHYDRFVVLTENDRKSWGSPANCMVIPNMNTFSTSSAGSLESKQVLALGRLTYLKGFDLLILAWEKVIKMLPDWHLNISGEGEEYDNLQKLIKDKGLESSVSILPYTHQIINRLMEHSIFVLSSRHEGFGLVLTEAMECGIPCIAFRCQSGPSEIIKDGEDGYLVNEGDLNNMAQRIIQLAQDPNLRIEMGRKAKINVKRFAEEVVLSKWKTLFQNL